MKGTKGGAPRGPRTFDPKKHCGAKARSKGSRPCTHGAGERTDHPGKGRCWMHGGRNPIKTGLYSTLGSDRVRDAIARVQEQAIDIMDLEPEVTLLRALLVDYVERQETMRAAVLSWHSTFEPGFQLLLRAEDPAEILKAIESVKDATTKRPREVSIDIDSAARLAVAVGQMVERIHKIKQTSAVTWQAVQILLERMGMVLMKHLKEQPQVVEAIQRDWGEIDIPVATTR